MTRHSGLLDALKRHGGPDMGRDCTDLRHTRPRPAGRDLVRPRRTRSDHLAGGVHSGRPGDAYRCVAGVRFAGWDRRRPAPGGVPRRRRAPALQGVREEGGRQDLAGRGRPGPWAVGRPARRGAAVPGLGRDLVRDPHAPPDPQRGRLRPYRSHLKPAFGDLLLKDLTPMRIRTFVAELSGRRAPGTVRRVHALLSSGTPRS